MRRSVAAVFDRRVFAPALALFGIALAAAGDGDRAARYDQLFAAHDYGTLSTQLKNGMEGAATAAETLAWEQRHVAAGSSVFVGAIYAIDLLSTARGGDDAPVTRMIRENTVAAALYTMAAIETDGTKCADSTAPSARRRQFVQILTPVWIELRRLPDDAVARVLARALSEEQAIAAARAPDDYLCRGLTSDIPKVFASGAKERMPRFLPPSAWMPAAAAVRAKLPDLLTEFAVRVKSGS